MSEHSAKHRADSSQAAGFSSFEVVASVFSLLTSEPAPLALAGADLELPGEHLRLDELQVWLAGPQVSCASRDAVWRALAGRARSMGPAWVVGAAGVALPSLRQIAARLVNGCTGDRVEVEAAVLSGFVGALRHMSLEQRHIEQGLLWTAHRAGAWRLCGAASSGRAGPGGRIGARFRAVLPDQVTLARIFG
ncbi:hypothetical protein [Actinomadura sp. 6N118]|uniref:hypothetical protein n=1 Tax=Actinomadura sp. 6N118 TaxID=3375151 RepID=UPI0037AC46F7